MTRRRILKGVAWLVGLLLVAGLAAPYLAVDRYAERLQRSLERSLGRRVEYYDGPAIRKIANDAESTGYRMQDFILGVVKSDAFRMKRIPTAAGH